MVLKFHVPGMDVERTFDDYNEYNDDSDSSDDSGLDE